MEVYIRTQMCLWIQVNLDSAQKSPYKSKDCKGIYKYSQKKYVQRTLISARIIKCKGS